MEKMLAVVFDNEAKAYEGSQALKQLDYEGSISIHSESIIKKNADGTIAVEHTEGDFPVRGVGGTALGALIGLLGGPVGLGVGAVAGALAGSLSDLYVSGVDADFVDQVADTLKPGKCAVIADVSEEWVTPVDTKMEPLGGTVLRAPKKSFEQEQRARHIQELRAEIDQLKAEQARARDDRKAAQLQSKIDKLNVQAQKEQDQATLRLAQIKTETDAKAAALQKKSEKAQGDVKTTLNEREKQIRGEYEQSEAQLKQVLAAKPKTAAQK